MIFFNSFIYVISWLINLFTHVSISLLHDVYLFSYITFMSLFISFSINDMLLFYYH